MTIKRMPVAEPFVPPSEEALAREDSMDTAGASRRARRRELNDRDGTRQLLVSGFWTMLVGVVAGLMAATVFGGVGPQGAHTNAGWLSLMVAMMATPFAVLLLLLGGAKWLRNNRLSRARPVA